MEGREPTARKVSIEDNLLVASFFSFWDPFLPSKGKRPCVMEDCDHLIGTDCGGAATCAAVVRADRMDEYLGFACSHCCDEILHRAGYGQDPPF